MYTLHLGARRGDVLARCVVFFFPAFDSKLQRSPHFTPQCLSTRVLGARTMFYITAPTNRNSDSESLKIRSILRFPLRFFVAASPCPAPGPTYTGRSPQPLQFVSCRGLFKSLASRPASLTPSFVLRLLSSPPVLGSVPRSSRPGSCCSPPTGVRRQPWRAVDPQDTPSVTAPTYCLSVLWAGLALLPSACV